ncbi:MAG: M23 family metallopeptidase, partial [Alphaproteobacteria bacterium]|nr:M23 family metallopeptidase [Alphaproteobacteria bacterium]
PTLESSALESSALESPALESPSLESSALESSALESSALESSALESHAHSPDTLHAAAGHSRESAFLPAPVRQESSTVIQNGDFLYDLLAAQSSAQTANRIVVAFESLLSARTLRPGKRLSFVHVDTLTDVAFDSTQGTGPSTFSQLDRVVYHHTSTRHLQISRLPSDQWEAQWVDLPMLKRFRVVSGTIEDNLFATAALHSIPTQTISDAVKLLSFVVDFQREIWPGASFQLVYEEIVLPSDAADPLQASFVPTSTGGRGTRDEALVGEVVGAGDIHLIAIEAGGKFLEFFRYEDLEGNVDYFTSEGHSARKALMRTPVDATRISSGFGLRRHPISGYDKLHRGVDFAAPEGTPIYAAGDGVIVRIGPNGGYGNYILLRHNSEYRTAYAHLHRFAPGMRKGVRVKQGQTIGYVGSTGRSTGPHLHYEVVHAGRAINPMEMRLPQSRSVSEAELPRFLAVQSYQKRQAADSTASLDSSLRLTAAP